MQIKKHTKLLGFSDRLDSEYEENRGLKDSSHIFGQDKKKFIFAILSFQSKNMMHASIFFQRSFDLIWGLFLGIS